MPAAPTGHDRRITAVLGPTNTGKTHLAMERMLAHRSGLMGFPLRLLARENYDRAVRVKGVDQVALVTGEEKIVPPNARYFLCTVEAMPADLMINGSPPDFLAIDEIQVCADPDRGHIFTDRLLHVRGLHETLFLGAESMRPIIRRLVPAADFETRPRLSQLRFAGQQKLSRLKPRSAVVAFTANDVYAIAEVLRRQRGGTAVVLGALSPRTRNAQVAMYQAGEVDYLVATDAIGMGLNMDVQNVTFASIRKFDGKKFRHLQAAELAQIAGRAGRHANDGTFGVTPEAGELPPETIQRIEEHDFDPLRHIYWRNDDLDFSGTEALLQSLRTRSDRPELARVREADDERALAALAREAHVAERAPRGDDLRLLWEVCQVPDFEQQWTASHGRFLDQVYRHLTGDEYLLPTDWIAEHIERIDRADGGIDTLMGRIARIRTWTYMSHKTDWMADADHWQGRTREIEDKLSDALHDGLTQRFVDRRTAALLGGLRKKRDLIATVRSDGDVLVEGQYVGRLEGLRFFPDDTRFKEDRRAILGAVVPVVASQVQALVADLMATGEGVAWPHFDTLTWRGEPFARVRRGRDMFEPIVSLLPNNAIEGELRNRFGNWAQGWIDRQIIEDLAPLCAAPEDATPTVRGLLFRLREHLGAIPRREVERDLKDAGKEDRKTLRKAGYVIGREAVFSPVLLKPAAMRLRANLWALWHEQVTPMTLPEPGVISFSATTDPERSAFLNAVGFRVFQVKGGARALRIDMVDRLVSACWDAGARKPFVMTPDILSLTGLGEEGTIAVLRVLGFREIQPKGVVEGDAKEEAKDEAKEERRERFLVVPRRHNEQHPAARSGKSADDRNKVDGKNKRRKKIRPTGLVSPPAKHKEKPIDPDSPFAILGEHFGR